jgi:pimeloyl-ACP methyl ester carboxylesterase
VRARRGGISDADVTGIERRLPGAHVVTFDTGHNVQEDDPVALARLVADRLED